MNSHPINLLWMEMLSPEKSVILIVSDSFFIRVLLLSFALKQPIITLVSETEPATLPRILLKVEGKSFKVMLQSFDQKDWICSALDCSNLTPLNC